MKRIKIAKEFKHDYAGFGQKLYRKLHALFYKICGSREAAYPFYASYRHRKKKAKSGERDFYITEEPVYLAGFGHGLGGWRTGLISAEVLGLSYAYTPMVDEDWDRTLGLGCGMVQAADLLRQGYKKVRLPYYEMGDEKSLALIRQIIDSYGGRKIVFYNEYEQWTKKGDDIRGDEKIKKIFWDSPRRKEDNLLYDPEKISIALHIRRGDVGARLDQGDETMRARWMELSYYVGLMRLILSLTEDRERLEFFVFSEGKESDFRELEEAGVPLHYCLDMSAPQSFLHLCHADVLLTAPSSFSVIAGAIGKGINIIPDRKWLTWPRTAEWIPAADDGTIAEEDKGRLKAVL